VYGDAHGPQARLSHSIVYDPLNERLVVLGGRIRLPDPDGWRDADDVLAFDTRNGMWRELLPPSEPYPPTASSMPVVR